MADHAQSSCTSAVGQLLSVKFDYKVRRHTEFVGEASTLTIFYPYGKTSGGKDIGPAIRHLDEVRAVSPQFFELLSILIGAFELNRALKGWKSLDSNTFQDLKENYYPGDVGFDPLGLKPADGEDFLNMSTKELQHGRLAMLGVAGMVAQELINGKEIFVNAGLAADRFDPSTLPIQF
jgi:hypothetical protein